MSAVAGAKAIPALALLFLSACAPSAAEPASSPDSETSTSSQSGASNITYAGGDGLTCEKAVVIVGATGSMDGVPAEYDWIEQHYPGAQSKGQALTECAGKPTDRIIVVTADGRELELFFDVSGFFGKL